MILKDKNKPLIVILGPTASGKTSLAIELASKYGGEIICADSRTIYKGMDVGTAKPSKNEQMKVPHWGIDLIKPNRSYSASDFKKYCNKKIKQIRSRGNIPFLVGGTGLYIDSVILDYKFGSKVNNRKHRKYENMTLLELMDYCRNSDIELPENYKNKRYVIRAIEHNGKVQLRRGTPITNTYVVGISTSKEELKSRIAKRTSSIICPESIQETKMVGQKYGWDGPAMTSNAYSLLKQYLRGEKSLDDVLNISNNLDWQLAKKQLTWFKRNEFIQWLGLSEAERYISQILQDIS